MTRLQTGACCFYAVVAFGIAALSGPLELRWWETSMAIVAGVAVLVWVGVEAFGEDGG